MSKKKKILIALITCLGIVILAAVFFIRIMPRQYWVGDYKIQKYDGFMNVSICGYRGDETMEIPATIGPFNVVHIDPDLIKDNKTITSIYVSPNIDSKVLICVTNCENLKKIEVAQGNKSFYLIVEDCNNLEELIIPEGLEEIKGYFWDCPSLGDIHFPDSLKVVTKYDFDNTKFYELHKEEKYFVVGDGALLFFNGDYYQDIIIPSGIKSFYDVLYEGSETSQRKIYIPETISLLGIQVWEGDTIYFGNQVFDKLDLVCNHYDMNGTIVAPANSYMEHYCKENGYNFRVMTEEEEKTWRELTDAATFEITYQE